MVSSKDIASLRPANKRLLDLIYAHAKETGLVLSPEKAVRLLAMVIMIIVEPGRPPHLWENPGPVTDELHKLAVTFYRQALHDAVDVSCQDRPELKVKKGKPGPKPNVELARRIWALDAEGKTNRQIHEIVNSEVWNISLEAVESYLKTRRKKPQE